MQLNVAKRLMKVYEELLKKTFSMSQPKLSVLLFVDILNVYTYLQVSHLSFISALSASLACISAFDFTRVILFMVVYSVYILYFSLRNRGFYGFLPLRRTNAFMGILLYCVYPSLTGKSKQQKQKHRQKTLRNILKCPVIRYIYHKHNFENPL